jgi:hypothetical protein
VCVIRPIDTRLEKQLIEGRLALLSVVSDIRIVSDGCLIDSVYHLDPASHTQSITSHQTRPPSQEVSSSGWVSPRYRLPKTGKPWYWFRMVVRWSLKQVLCFERSNMSRRRNCWRIQKINGNRSWQDKDEQV